MRLCAIIAVIAMLLPASAAVADGCPKPSDDIATDRPDVTNSSIVVPVGSLQNENGINLSSRSDELVLDGTNSRLRLGVAPCLELLVDLPTYFSTIRGQAGSGFSNVTPAVKWQISPMPGTLDLSATVGVGLPTGATNIAGPGVQPYLQFPWSRELAYGWSLRGMTTLFFRPSDPISQLITEPTFVIEKKLGERADVFVEYVGDFPDRAGPRHLLNSGAAYRLTPTQQIDFHVGVGLNRNAPTWLFGLGYSIRRDGLF
jgi:hypothetical protein